MFNPGDAAAQRNGPGIYQVILAAAAGATVGLRVDQDLLLAQIEIDTLSNG